MKICFDIDGVLCNQVEGDYDQAKPNEPMIAMLNRLYDRGHYILLHTSRFMGRAQSVKEEAERIGLEYTRKQLAGWGVRYHALHMGKPRYDFLIDDRSVSFEDDPEKIEAFLEARTPAPPGE